MNGKEGTDFFISIENKTPQELTDLIEEMLVSLNNLGEDVLNPVYDNEFGLQIFIANPEWEDAAGTFLAKHLETYKGGY